MAVKESLLSRSGFSRLELDVIYGSLGEAVVSGMRFDSTHLAAKQAPSDARKYQSDPGKKR